MVFYAVLAKEKTGLFIVRFSCITESVVLGLQDFFQSPDGICQQIT
jgi:hypothetical protein